MPSSLTPDMIHTALRSVLEDAAFIMAEPADPGTLPDGAVVEASMQLGEGLGELRLRAGVPFASMLAANLLGEEPDSPEATNSSGQAMGELLNMVAGGLVAAAGGHSLGIPAVSVLAAGESNSFWNKAACRAAMVTDEGHRVEMAVWTHAGGAP